MTSLATLRTSLLVALASPVLRADVLVVDPSGLGDYTTVAAAVAAAVDGDTVLVRPAFYPKAQPIEVDGKSIEIVGSSGPPDVQSGLIVRNLPAGGRVVIAEIELGRISLHADTPGLQVLDCAGSVRVETSRIKGRPSIARSGDVVFDHCILRGRTGPDSSFVAFPGASGLIVTEDSKVALYDCVLRGGKGGFGADSFCTTCSAGGDGGPGCFVDGTSELYAMGTAFHGGDGRPGGVMGPTGLGAPGLVAELDSTARCVQCVFYPGQSPCGLMAPDFEGPIEFSVLTRRELIAPTVVSENSTNVWTLIGRPGDRVYLPTSDFGDYRYVPNANGVLTLGPPIALGPLVGTIGAGSTLDISVPVGSLPPGVESDTQLFQLFALTADGVRVLGGIHAQVVLDESF